MPLVLDPMQRPPLRSPGPGKTACLALRAVVFPGSVSTLDVDGTSNLAALEGDPGPRSRPLVALPLVDPDGSPTPGNLQGIGTDAMKTRNGHR